MKMGWSGYPSGFREDDIPVAGRLMAVADVYDALISKRVYKPAFSHEKAMDIIHQGRGQHFDPYVIDALDVIEDQFIEIADAFRDDITMKNKNVFSWPIGAPPINNLKT